MASVSFPLAGKHKQGTWFGVEGSEDYDSFFSCLYGLSPQDSRADSKIDDDQKQSIQVSQPAEKSVQNEQQPTPFSLACLEVLKTYDKLLNKPTDEGEGVNHNNKYNASSCSCTCGKLSVNEVLKLGGERYIQYITPRADGFSMFMHPYASALSALTAHETRDVELVHLLLAAAEDVSRRQYDVAANLISRCMWTASHSGNPVQRLVFYFAEALKERIDRETTGRLFTAARYHYQEYCMGLTTTPATLACHQGLPFSQVMQFAGIQAIIENVNTTKIHLLDFNIRSGIQWTILMQALAEEHHDRPIQLIKITAVGVADQHKLEECGNRLESFARSLNLPFAFHLVFLSDLKDFREDLVHLEADESVAVYANTVFRTMIGRPDCLDSLILAIRKLKPVVMVVAEVEANHNSPSFITRFIEALFFYGAFFDCFEDCMERKDTCRRTIEGIHFGEGIINIVAAEGEERFTRNVKIDVWRAFFARLGMVEIKLSECSMYQAKLILKQFEHGSSCNLYSNGNGLIVGWKGTPIHSVTCWKFNSHDDY
nr:DELLA protein RGL1-like [Ipomoea trifida]